MSVSLTKTHLNSLPEHSFFVLDIDSTLVTTHQRNQAILESFIAEMAQKFPEDCEALKAAQCQLGDYGLRSSLERIDFTPVDKDSKQALDDYWRANFFTNDYLNHDQPTPGAVEWVKSLAEANVPFVYLTARHHEQMWSGTLSSLEKIGFPISEEILFLKEDLNDSDAEYKSKALTNISQEIGEKSIWFVDNEPVVLHKILEDFPETNLVWFESTHSGKMQPPEQALAINSFL